MSDVGQVLTGFAQALPQGIQLGNQRTEIAVKQQEVERQLQAQQAEAERKKQEGKLQEFGKALDFFKEVPPSLKADTWKSTIAPKANAIFGTKFDPNVYPDEATPLLNDAQSTIEKWKNNKISFQDTVGLLTQIQGKLVAAGDSKSADQVDKLTGNIQAAQTSAVSAQNAPAGTRYLPEFLSNQMLKSAGLTDQQIVDGQRTGKVPTKLTRDEAALIIQSKKSQKFSLKSSGQGYNANDLSNEFGF